MPKGKARKNNPGMYEEFAQPQQPGMAPQAAAHRRGGTHRVRDKDRTDSIYDSYNYIELLREAKERKVYRKDMKKVDMAKALRDDDLRRTKAEHFAFLERQKREQEKKNEQQRKANDRQRQ